MTFHQSSFVFSITLASMSFALDARIARSRRPVAAFPGGADKHFDFGGSQESDALRELTGFRCLAGPTTDARHWRRLVMEAQPPAPRQRKDTARRASELAAKTIVGLADKSRPASERARAKRRLIHGPKEFRDVRTDQPNGKRR